MKILYFDLERGSQTLGNQDKIQKMFGLPMLAPSTYDAFEKILAQIYTEKKTKTNKKIGNLDVTEEHIHKTLNKGIEVNALVVDTFSELSKKYQRQLVSSGRGATGTMKLQDWGKLRNTLDHMLDRLTSLPGIVICNCHAKVQTMDDGNKLMPYIDGGTKEDISKWFDFVFYTTTTAAPSGLRHYKWVTQRTEKYDNAKDRTALLDPVIDQDYQIPINAARERGFENCRILVIGSPGSGKTYALNTLLNTTNRVSATKKTTKTTNQVTTTSNGMHETQTTEGVIL